MTVVSTTNPTLVDVAKRLDPDGSIANIAEVLTKKNPLLQDMTWVEGNLPTGHRYTSRTALPSLTWRKLNAGVAPSKSATGQVDESCGMLEGYSKVDVDLAALNGNSAAFRASEDIAFVEAFNQEVATSLFYSSTAETPEEINGLSPRLSDVTSTAGATQIIDAGGSTDSDNCSIWLLNWSEAGLHGIFPKGSKAGLSQEDLGKQVVGDSAGYYYTAWMTKWQWKLGLCVKDYRYIARIGSIDHDALATDMSTGADLAMLMMDAIAAIYDIESGRPAWYMNRLCFSKLNQQLVARSSGYLEWMDKGGRMIPHFLGIPIRVCDALTETENDI